MTLTPTLRSAADLMPLAPELVLAAGAFALLMLDLFLDERRRVVTHLGAIVLLLVATGLVLAGVGGQGVVMDGMFVRDTMADVLKVGMLLLSALSLAYIWPFMRDRGLYKGEIAVLVLFATIGMMLMVSAGNLAMVYVGLELLALCQYALVAIDRDGPVGAEAGMKYFVLGSLASGLLLFGLSLVYGATGSLDLATIAAAAPGAERSQLLTGKEYVVAGHP